VAVKANELSACTSEPQSEQAIHERWELVIGDVQQPNALVGTVGGVQRTGTCVRRQGFACRPVMPSAVPQGGVERYNRHPTGKDFGFAADPANPDRQSRLDAERGAPEHAERHLGFCSLSCTPLFDSRIDSYCQYGVVPMDGHLMPAASRTGVGIVHLPARSSTSLPPSSRAGLKPVSPAHLGRGGSLE
jgi:hypothetical protein